MALLIDGVQVGGHCIVVALGLDTTGAKHPLGLWEGSTENTTVCQGLLSHLESRGLRTDRRLLVILAGAQALHTAVTQTLGRCRPGATMSGPETADCARVSTRGPASVGEGDSHARLYAQQYQDGETSAAGPGSARGPPDYPRAAASVREGLDDTLTVLGLGLSERLPRSLATTNAIESLLSRPRQGKRNVKRWRGGTMVLRWVAAEVLEATTGFHRVNGGKDMPALVAALRARDVRLGLGEWSEMVA